METVGVDEAKRQLEDLIARAARGEEVVIVDPVHGSASLRFIHTPAKGTRRPGLLKGKVPPLPDEFFAPLGEAELKDFYGEQE